MENDGQETPTPPSRERNVLLLDLSKSMFAPLPDPQGSGPERQKIEVARTAVFRILQEAAASGTLFGLVTFTETVRVPVAAASWRIRITAVRATSIFCRSGPPPWGSGSGASMLFDRSRSRTLRSRVGGGGESSDWFCMECDALWRKEGPQSPAKTPPRAAPR